MGTSILEQSLYIHSNKGIIVLTGCAHPGIESIVERTVEEKNAQILLIMGGFHLLRTGKNAVQEIALEFEEMNIEYAAPTHCSGDKTLEIFREIFGDHYLEAGAGRVIHTAELN